MRIDFDTATTDTREMYALLNATVLPRPIAWISTTSDDGVDNLAPHSYFNIASTEPPILQFASLSRKDTLRNIEQNGQFVVNLAAEPLAEHINATATDFPPDVSEFDVIGLEREPSAVVKPPRVAASPVAIECELHSTIFFGSHTVVFGRVVHVAVDKAVMVDGHPDVNRLRPLGRLGKWEWSTIGDVFDLAVVRHKDCGQQHPNHGRRV
jgi:flavin reductase (DIM6/NTAB) family NADH-FMN oxidoreductase RutF